MLLIEIAEQYAESALLIDRRIKELEAANTAGIEYTDSSTLSKLKQVRRELRRSERACRFYYERGYWMDEEFRAYRATKCICSEHCLELSCDHGRMRFVKCYVCGSDWLIPAVKSNPLKDIKIKPIPTKVVRW